MLPVKKGNLWVYTVRNRLTGEVYENRYIIKDSLMASNGKTYYKVENPDYQSKDFQLIRKDSTGLFYFYSAFHQREFLYFKPNAELNENWYWDDDLFGGMEVTVMEIFYYSVFKEDVIIYFMWLDRGIITYGNYYCEKFGLVGWNMSESDDSYGLKGCVIDGVVYGDTTKTQVGVPHENPKPNKVILGQNYPNPFNPSTTIPFRLTQAGQVKISIFDVSGKEIRVLSQGFRVSGDQQVTFSGDDLPSGLYLIRLEAESQVLSKKMILLK